MAQEINAEGDIPVGYRWEDLAQRQGNDQFDFYRRQLVALGTAGSENIRTIFANPTSLLRHAESLSTLVSKIDELDWYNAKREGLGDLYEGLLEKNASEKKSGAGQYFTPRPLIEAIVEVMRPRAEELIHDPAAGTGGFLVVANEYAKNHAVSLRSGPYFVGVELVQDTHRLLLMNAILHGMDGSFLRDDSLSADGAARIPLADVILTNPPFGNKRGGGLPGRRDLPFPTTSKQLAFLQHVYLGLKPGGRAAVVVPDSVLFEGNIGQQIRQDIMSKCNLHTILRLPDNIFYANVTTNVLFLEKSDLGTSDVWIYDMRANMPPFGKRTPLRRSHFAEFEAAYGQVTDGSDGRTDQGEQGRFRCFSREAIERRRFNLAISWLPDERHRSDEKPSDPDEIAYQIRSLLEGALDELDQLVEQTLVESPREPARDD